MWSKCPLWKTDKVWNKCTTYGEVEYSNGEASLIKIYNWGTLERISTTAHKKAYAITYTGKKPADIEVGLAVLGERGGTSVRLK